MNNTRLTFLVVSLITITLLVGSVVLQRIVFSAAESSSSVYTSPSNFIVKPDGQIKLDVINNFSIPAFVAGGQFVFEFNKTNLVFKEAKTSGDFVTERVVVQDNNIFWAVTPASTASIVGKFSGDTVIGQLIFDAVKLGSTEISLLPEKTIVSAIDPQGSTALYNSVVSTQGSVGEITNSTDISSVGQNLINEVKELNDGFVSQKIIRNISLPLVQESLHIVELNNLGLVNIAYGKTSKLGNLVKTSTVDTSHEVRLNNLEPNTKYYYQVRVLSPDSEYIFSDSIKTFNTAIDSISNNIEKVEVVVKNSILSKETTLYLVATDDSGNIVYPSGLTFEVTKGSAEIIEQEQGRPEQVLIGLLTNIRQRVVVATLLDGRVISETSLDFDPSKVEQVKESIETKTSFSTSTQITLATLLLVILLSGLALTKLIRVK